MNVSVSFWLFLRISEKNRNQLIARLLAVFRNLTPERNELIARFLSIFRNLKPARTEVFAFYYINTNEIPGELSREKMISSHVKITCYFHT